MQAMSRLGAAVNGGALGMVASPKRGGKHLLSGSRERNSRNCSQ